MKPLCPEALAYLQTQRVSVLAVEMLDGSPHAATVHFAYANGEFLFETSRKYRKVEPLLARGTTRASFVVGVTEGPAVKTLQMDGTLRLLEEPEVEKADYLSKFPEKAAKAEDPDNVFLAFTPSWWRFTDWGAPGGKTVYSSDAA